MTFSRHNPNQDNAIRNKHLNYQTTSKTGGSKAKPWRDLAPPTAPSTFVHATTSPAPKPRDWFLRIITSSPWLGLVRLARKIVSIRSVCLPLRQRQKH